MIRILLFLLAAAAVTFGLDLLAATPGTISIDWRGYTAELSVFQAVVGLALALAVGVGAALALRFLWRTPATVGSLINRRRERRGLDAISEGMIAIGAGDRQLALRAATQARKSLPNEPLTHLLRAQTAQLQGDNTTARRIFEAMLASPDTEQVGLRGLFMEASREGEPEAARQYAERALAGNPALSWPVDALFDLQTRAHDWDGALETLATARRHGHVDRALADRRRAVLLAAKAQALEHERTDDALAFALEAHKLAPDLVPAAAIAGRILAGKGQTPQAAKVLQKTWRLSPHPDLAAAYAHARIGDSPTDRIERIRALAKLDPNAQEGAIALASTAMEARDWATARQALAPYLEPARLTQRVAALMARIENSDGVDIGRAREWLARAVHAPRDPAWTADGVVSETWAPVSPVTGQLDAFQWRIPVSDLEPADPTLIAERTERLLTLGPARARAADAIDIEAAVRTVPSDVVRDDTGLDEPSGSPSTAVTPKGSAAEPRAPVPSAAHAAPAR